LPMHLFGGDVRRAEGLAGRLLPTRRVAHRLLLGRYRRSNPLTVFPSGTTKGGWIHHPHIGLVALGVDGTLRVGEWWGPVRLPTAEAPAVGLFPWSHPQLRGVPPGHLVLEEWQPAAQERAVADPAEVIAALRRVVTDLAQLAARDAAVIRGESS